MSSRAVVHAKITPAEAALCPDTTCIEASRAQGEVQIKGNAGD